MENRRIRHGIAEITEQAYARRNGINTESRHRWWHVRTKIIMMTIICFVIGSLVLYWFVNSILENHRNGRDKSSMGSRSWKQSYLDRLSTNVLPIEYTLKVLPFLEEENFTAVGDVQIRFYCSKPVKHIRLHAHAVQIRMVTLKEFNFFNASRTISKYILTGQHFIDIFLMQFLNSGESYVLQIKYNFVLNEQPIGLFRSKYVNCETNRTRWIAVSNFSPDYAHWAFPCFDEPWIKTPFRISIGRKSEMRSHSNSMRKVTEDMQNIPGYVWDHYEKTPPMSTYVVAFMVTDFSGYNIDVNDRPFHTIYARKEILMNTEYMRCLIPKILRTLQNFTGFFYEPDKLDVIVVPSLAYAAMENWGLITFREDSIIKGSNITGNVEKFLAQIAAHEVAHQWFGNLLTPKWWSDVWLKEGFSSFFGNLALSVIEPSWTLEEMFLEQFYNMFEISGEEKTHPLHIDMNTVKRLRDVFDETSYVKGNCVVYMMFHFLGRTTFLSSIRRYVQAYYYRSADQENVWNVFQEEIILQKSLPQELTMKDIMRTWTDQSGHPVVHVETNQQTGAILLTQNRFYNRGSNTTSKNLWYIPLTWTTANDQQFNRTTTKAWMIERQMKLSDTSLSQAVLNKKWILFNVNLTGLYRVNYDAFNWQLLIKYFKDLPTVAKTQLLSDAFALTNAGLLDHRTTWNILKNLEAESDEILWSIALIALDSIQHALWDSNAYKRFTDFTLLQFLTCKLASRVYALQASSLMYTDPKLWTRFQLKLMKWVCSTGHKTCLTVARNLGKKVLFNDSFSSIPEKYRTWIYCTYVKVVPEEQWLTLFQRYKSSEARDKDSLAYALGCHSNATLLSRYLSFLSVENKTEQKYLHSALLSMVNNPHGLDTVVEFFSPYWAKMNVNGKQVSDSLSDSNQNFIDVLLAFAIYMNREENVEWLKRLKEVNETYDNVIDEVIDKIRINAAWNEKHKAQTLGVVADIIKKHKETHDCAKRTDEP